MPLTAEKADLLARVSEALRLSGWRTLWLNDDHPATARLIRNDAAVDAWIYIWNLTPGGRPQRRPLERRIQPTGVGDRFRSSPGVRTLIFGWSTEAGVFAAFDHRFHTGRFGVSPSIQTDLPALEAAAADGLGVYSKSTGELSIAVRPDLLGFYLERMDVLHTSGSDPVQLSLLRRMASDPLEVELDEIEADVPKRRQKIMATTLRLLRDRRFGANVLAAYGHRCAFCALQLRLLDAAHILPVAHPDSNDRVTNGVALCALHHRAYDAALLTFAPSFEIRISQAAMAQLEASGRGGGLQAFLGALQQSILLPDSAANYPSSAMVAKANALRGWT